MRSVVVETGLAEEAVSNGQSFTLHARSRFVAEAIEPELSREPRLGDPWEPLTVRARLERMGETYRRLPHAPDTRPQQHRSCMPTPVREPWKDAAPGPLRTFPSDEDIAASNAIVDVLSERERAVAWAIANRMSDRKLGRHIGTSHHTAAARKQDVLRVLAAQWTARDWLPDAEDIARAKRFIHKIFD